MSARENSPLQCLSPLTSEMEHETSIQAEFKSFSNPTLGLSVSCSLAQLADLKQMLTPALADQAQQAPFFTPFSNKTYDSVQVSDSVAFYTAMETGLRSSQTVRTDVHGSVQSRKLLGKALLFGDGIPTGCAKANGSRPSSHGSGVAALEPSKPVNISALDKPAAPAVKIMDDEAPEIANQAVAAVSNSVAVTDVSQIPAREPDEESDCLDRAEADADTLDLASTDNGVQPECSERTPADSTSLCRPLSLAGDSSCSTELDDAAQSPANLDDLTMEALLPANFLLDNLLEGSGETSGNPNLVCPRTTRKPSPGPAESTHAQGQPPIIPKREKVYGSCTPRLAHAGVAPGGASTARKVHGSGTALHRQRSDVRDTPASSAKLVTSGKQSQARTGKANTTATNTPGRQSSQKPRRPSSVGADAAREAAPKMAGHTTPPHSAGKTGTAMLPAAGDAKAVPVALAPAENQTAAAVGTGTPFFVKRVRPALGSSPPVTPFSAMKCPPAVRGQAGGTGATATASPAAVIPTAAAPTGAGPPPEQRAKRSVRAKAQATVPAAAKAADPDAKTGQETKAAPGPGRGGETRRNSSANAAAKTASGTKPAAPGAAKSGSVPGGTRAAVAHAAKLSAPAGPAAVHGKQAGSKHTGDVVTKAQAEEAELDEPIEAHPVILGRVSPVGGLGASSAAACRYGKAEAAVSDLSTEPTNGRAACHSPDKLPPSKRQAIPITSPSKRPRQERNPSVTAQVLVTARPASVGCRGGAVRAASRPASSPAARGALAGKSNRSQSASVRRPRPSLPSATAEVAPSQISLQAAPGDAGKDAPAQPLLPVSSPTVAKPLTLVKAQHVPKLNLDSLVPCKSPIGTPHMRNNAAAVAADMVPLRQQPVSTRSPVLPGSAAVSSRRPSAMSLSGVLAAADVAQVVLPPAVAAAEVQGINAVVKQGPIMPVPHKQLESQENAREPPADPPRRDGRPTLDPSHGGAGKAKASNERAAAAAPAAAGDGIRPLTARYVTRVPATAVAHGPAAPRSLSARPSGVHKPVSAMGSAACYGSAVPKATAGAAGALKTAAAPLQAITGAGKLAKSAAFAATTAPAPKARPTVPHGNRQGDAAPQRNRVAEPQVPGAAVEDNKSVQRQVPRGGTVTAVQPTRQEVPSRSARLDAEQERAQRRRQYEALLGRSGPVSHVSQELGVSAVDATAILAPPANGASAPAPAVKPAVKPPGVRMSIQASVPQQEKVLVRKAPVPQANPARASTRQPAGSGDGCPAPQPQRGKVASPAFKQTASGTATGNGSRTARGRPDGSAAAADARTPRVRTPLIATEHGSGRKEGQLGMAAATSTAASEEPFDTQHPGSFLAIDEGPKQADAGKDAKESSTPTRPNDLSWLVDTSPQTSLAATPGALNAVHHVFADASSFGFGPAQEDGTEPDASSPNFHVFGASPGEPQLQLVASPSALCEGGEPTGPFGGCQGDATAVVRKQPAFAAAHPVGLPPTGLAPGGLGANAVPSSVFSVRSVQQLTPGPGLYKFTAANRAKAAMGGANNCDDAPAMLPQAKLRFSWDPAATGAIPGQPGVYTCPSPGMADSFLGFGTAAVQEATPVSIPDAAGFCVVTDIGGRLVSVGALGDAENTLDQDLGVEVPIPMQCTSPNTPPSDAYGALGGGAGAVDQGVVMFGGGGGGGMGRAGRVVQDSFDALRISSMSSWPMLRDREPADV
ncbi:hypothetical protein Vretimale_4938 [Volvox reticuliferus]|uniref:Uncharacterized protein n=1 Tax=Volvox reticuliferus TaxID=1737510 RepID=A0A8J4G542_9CHLO|nr:hypothetical protein Vretifemale_4135 [Volvox reticuliferus]GIL99889.1 hypothetical protein Vretimale_4938 [Volvox reticuliferus]